MRRLVLDYLHLLFRLSVGVTRGALMLVLRFAQRSRPENALKVEDLAGSVAIARFDGLGDHVLTLDFIEKLVQVDAVDRVDFFVHHQLHQILTRFEHPKLRWIALEATPSISGSKKNFVRQWLTCSFFGIISSKRIASNVDKVYDVGFAVRPATEYATNARWFLRGISQILVGFNHENAPLREYPDRFEWSLLDVAITLPNESLHESLKPLALIGKPELESRLDYFLLRGPELNRRLNGKQLWLHPFASSPSRELSLGTTNSLLGLVESEFDCVTVVGSESEIRRIRPHIRSSIRFVASSDLPGEAVDQKNDVFVGTDSGMGHFFAALGVRTVTVSPNGKSWSSDAYFSATRVAPNRGQGVWLGPSEPMAGCSRLRGCNASEPHCITRIPAKRIYDEIRWQALNLSKREENGNS